MPESLQNWARNRTFAARRVHRPASIDEVRELVAACRAVRALGTRHSFNDIADTTDDLVSLERLNRVISFDLDSPRPTVTIEAGVSYGQLCRELHARGFALRNLASLPHTSVAGACATATHGSGDANGNLATAVTAIEAVTAEGGMQVLSRALDQAKFSGAVVGLGSLGIVVKLTLEVVPTFDMAQEVFEDLPLSQLDAHFASVMSAGYSVSLFTDWRSEQINQVWVKRRADANPREMPDPTAYGARRAVRDVHPISHMSAENCTPQLGVRGPWHERLPHFRMDYTPSSGEELQSEYFVPRQSAVAAILAVAALRERIAPLVQISEVRTVAADDLWMSPCYQQASVGIHFTWKKDWPAVREVLPLVERELKAFNARPHWAKLFTMTPEELQPLYPRLADFRGLLLSTDPHGKFRNAFVDRNIF